MTAIETLPEAGQFFAPAPSDLFDNLVAEYRRDRQSIEAAAEFIAGEHVNSLIGFFLSGNSDRRDRFPGDPRELFAVEGAVAALNAHYWQRALALTDVLDYMPQKRRDDWYDQIREQKTPEFNEETVRPTLLALLQQRGQFLAEKVDGMFKALSGEHVTNCPQAFGKRMIMYVRGDYGMENWRQIGHLNDLRAIIAKLMGRDEPTHGSTEPVIKAAYRQVGDWMEVDGGALRIRVYLKGTAHLEVHPDLAWQLNSILATIYPNAIPERLRRKPVKRQKSREWTEIQRPLPFAVLNLLGSMEEQVTLVDDPRGLDSRIRREPNTRAFPYADTDKHIKAEVRRVLEHIGGVWSGEHYAFDYDPTAVIGEIVTSGLIPDVKTHQYYPTPEKLAEIAVEMAHIGPEDTVLEPSAGTGNLARRMPKEPLCVEISELHCQVLEARGYEVIHGDFLRVPTPPVTRIVMNPPYADGRWQAHLQRAAEVLTPGGRLVAILPASAKGSDLLPGWHCEWSQTYDNEFPGASVSVAILAADKPHSRAEG